MTLRYPKIHQPQKEIGRKDVLRGQDSCKVCLRYMLVRKEKFAKAAESIEMVFATLIAFP